MPIQSLDLDQSKLSELLQLRKINQKKAAELTGVSAAAFGNWLSGDSKPTSKHFFALADALSLNEQEIAEVLKQPTTRVDFRKARNREPSVEVRERAKYLADLVFSLDGYIPTSIPPLVQIMASSPTEAIASEVKDFLGLPRSNPPTLVEVTSGLQKVGVEIIPLSFRKFGLLTDSNNSTAERAFIAVHKVNAESMFWAAIFIDADQTRDQALHTILHEVAHLFIVEESTEAERKCNEVAASLMYPFETLKTLVEMYPVLANQNASFGEIRSCFLKTNSRSDWTPKGFALALEKQNLISKESPTFRILMFLDKKKSAPQFCSHLFKDFDPSNLDILDTFFEKTVPENKDTLNFFNVIFTRALLGEVSYRLFAEILGMKFGDADEFLSNKRLSLDSGVDLETQNEF
jgi:transcriptional regulator with XRE-family HTH domain